MFRSTVEEAEKAWFFYEPLTLLYSYKALQKRIIEVYAPYRYFVERYSKRVQRKVSPIAEDCLEEHPEIAEQNVALLKNAMELWRAASRTSDAVAPMLYHYAWHCFNSFFAYTFFRWEPQHCRSHGISISKWSENIEDIKIQFRKEKHETTRGLFQRLIDTWTLLGAYSGFSSFLPILEGNEIEFIPNNYCLLNGTSCLSVKQLLNNNRLDFSNRLSSDLGNKLIYCKTPFISMQLPNRALTGYLIIFVASSLARYRPILWNSVLLGETYEQSQFAIHFRNALSAYTLGLDGFLFNVSHLLGDMLEGKFEFRSRGRRI